MTARFYAEDLGVSLEHAERVARFMSIATASKACINPRPWAKHGKVRVYFDVWSQNSRSPIDGLMEAYYDADEDDVIFVRLMYGQTIRVRLGDLPRKGRSYYSGAATRSALLEFAGVFYG